MAFFKSFQQNLPSVNISSILDSVSSRVDDLANAVSDVTYAVSDQLTEQVNTIINKVQEEEDGEQEAAQTSTAQEGKVGSKSVWPLSRESETSSSAKNNQSGDAAEAEYTASQLEWEWRDGCWRVKKTEAELAEEERRRKEEKELQEKREQRRKERRQKRLQEAAMFQKNNPQDEEAAEDDGLERTNPESPGEEATQHRGSDDHDGPEATEENDREHEEEMCSLEGEGEGEGDDEEAPDTAKSKVKKKKKDKKEKVPSKKADKVTKKKEKGKKNKKKEKSKQEAVLTDSEEERGPEAVVQSNVSTVCNSSSNMQATEQEGYSSEASSEHAGNSIQRMKKSPSLTEGQPPPYQDRDRGSAARVCRSRSRATREVRRGSSPQRCSSEASVDQDTESYLNKGCEEDIPSDSTAVVGPEDSSGPQLPTAYEPEPLGKYGTLDVAFEYDSTEQWLAVTVTAATDIPALKQTGNISWQVHLVLLPTKKQRAKTGVQKGPCPVFTETFKFSRVEQEALGDCAVRFRLYSIRRMKKEKVLGEKVFHLTKLNLQGKIALPVTLEPGSELTGCGSVVSVSRSAGALSYRSTEDSSLPEILLGLVYNSATGSLSAEVIQGSHFKTTSSDKPVNTYVTLSMLDSKGKEMSKCKTAVCRGQPSPTYKETFVFQVALFQLSEVSLVLSVFCRRSSMRPRERVGWVSLGLNSTSEEQLAHWTEMKEAEGQQVCHWHTLTDT
uniref:synaptotagmin-14b isoform X3 n=1 Tax=Doryrhamphus excisus TaxID=161450 RepID=UPI0025ADCF7C|nr:synaptotagmin-14b isoform X3 [Doryrhamphus excisus]